MRKNRPAAPGPVLLALVVLGALFLLTACGLVSETPGDEGYGADLEALDLPRRLQELSVEADAMWQEVVAEGESLEFEEISPDVWQERQEKSRDWRDRYQELSAQVGALPVIGAEAAAAHQHLEEALAAMKQQVELSEEFFGLTLELADFDEEDLSADDRERLESMLEELDDLESGLEESHQKHRQSLAAWEEAVELLR